MSFDISVIAIASATVRLVLEVEKLLRTLTQGLKPRDGANAPEVDCRQLRLQLDVDVAKIMSWYKLWFLDTDKSDDLFQALWGQAGHETIRGILHSVSEICEALKSTIKAMSERLEAQIRNTKSKRPDSWRKLLRLLQLPSKWKASVDWTKEIHNEIHALTGRIDDLWEKSELHFRLLHGVPPGHKVLADSAYVNAKVDDAVATRPASAALYWALQSCKTEIDLDLNLLNHDQDVDLFSDLFGWADLKLSYHVLPELRKESTTQLNLTFESCGIDEDRGGSICGGTDDLQVILSASQEAFTLQSVLKLPKGSNAGRHFHVKRESNENCNSDVYQEFHTAQQIHAFALSRTSANLVPLGVKMTVAYRLVESSLFLLGTPWLSHLTSNTIRLLGTTKLEYQCSLHVNVSSEAKSREFKSDHQIEAAQVVSIGLVLIEIALEGENISEATDGGPQESIMSVENIMGLSYRQACDFCLEQRRDGLHQANVNSESAFAVSDEAPRSSKMTSQFYKEVFLRLRDLYTL